jgi:hypothetical protein
MVSTDENPMPPKKQGEEAGEHDIQTDQRYKKLEQPAWMAKTSRRPPRKAEEEEQ